MRNLELFAGAGGLALGAALAGFESVASVEWDQWACRTLRANQRLGHPLMSSGEIVEQDARTLDFRRYAGVDLITGGPPCQPFSMAGRHLGFDDGRDMFPVAIDAVRTIAPRAFVFENVKGLTRQRFERYFSYIRLQLSFPEVTRRYDESWMDHLSRLERVATSERQNDGLHYHIVSALLNAADYGVPQRRERVFIVGFRSDVDAQFQFPAQTHSPATLKHDQAGSGTYWRRHGLHDPVLVSDNGHVSPEILHLKPWRTVRDALIDLPSPGMKQSGMIANHVFRVGAKSYKGHTGSPIDLPSKALKAGDHGVPGGENMILYPNGTVRYFTVREAARLQTFPDGFVLDGAWSEAMRQLGNAVPVRLAQKVLSGVFEALSLSTGNLRMTSDLAIVR